MMQAKRIYKKTVNKYRNEYINKRNNKLRQMSTSDPKNILVTLSVENVNMSDLFNHFKKLNEGANEDIPTARDDFDNAYLNRPIILEEVQEVIVKLKNHKAPGFDGVTNEYIKYSFERIGDTLTNIFNLTLSTGNFPEIWLLGIIKPIYKKKGLQSDPNNYRGITLVSCLSKVFTGVLNRRLSEFLEINGRANFSTIDHIFGLHLLIENFLAKGKKLYCAFIDYAKAFDTVWRGGLWFKLVNHGITGKCLTVIMNMYNGIKSMVEKENILSDVFPCNMGVRQGENLSPLLFALFLNDMERSFENLGSSGVDLNKELILLKAITVIICRRYRHFSRFEGRSPNKSR